MRRFAPRLLACALMGAGAAQASPFTVDQLLAQQRLGPVSVDPSQRWLVVPTTGPYDSAPRWDLEDLTPMTITRLSVFDLRKGGAPRVFPSNAGSPEAWGYNPGPYAPSGAKMAVTRARSGSLEVGILNLTDGAVVWTGLFPVTDVMGRSLQWRSDDVLLVLAKDPATPTTAGVVGPPAEQRLIDRWRATRENRVGVTVMGSGRYLDQTPALPPSRLVAVDATRGLGQVLAQGDFFDLEVAPGGRFVGLLSNGPPLAPDPSVPAMTTDPFRRHRLTVVDLVAGGAWSPCPSCDVAVDLLAWSPGGAGLLVYARGDNDPWSAARYWRIDALTRRAAPLHDRDITPMAETTGYGSRVPRADWMSETPVVLGRRGDASQDGADWFAWGAKAPLNLTAALPPGPRRLEATGPAGIVASQGGRLWRIDPLGRATLLGAGRSLQGAGLPGGERLVFNNRPRPEDLALMLDDGPRPTPVVLDKARLRPLGLDAPTDETLLLVAGQARAAVTLKQDAHGVETVLLRRAGQAPQALATLNAHLAQVDFSAPRAVSHLGPRGETLTSWLYMPTTPPSGAKVPLVVIPYPGKVYPTAPTSQGPPARQLYLNLQILAGAGYAVLLPSLPVDTRREPAEGLADRILAAADAAATVEPRLDLNRMGLWGHSYGGYAVLSAAAQSRQFKAVIAGAFAADLASHYTRKSLLATVAPDAAVEIMVGAGWMEQGQGRMGAPPWVDPDRYVRNSPLLHADRITAPVMLVMGDLDSDPGQALTMFGALFRQNKDAVSLQYHGETHVIMTAANVADFHRRLLAFLRDNLGTSPGS
jgi:dipeptidyl aminopeptidase/acylaminoacyl peptidase|uniref:Peptidase S9 prolyl oligopeptidase active site domain protein n=1 Tax=Caulobacter sp. (strain K31) TaxID=366602 RepID=B0T5V7_CAUSK